MRASPFSGVLFSLSALAAFFVTGGCASTSGPTMGNDLDKAGVQAALPVLAADLKRLRPDDAGKAKLFEDYLALHPAVYGVAFAPAPPPAGQPEGSSPYVFRQNGAFHTINLARPDYDYLHMDWYTVPIANTFPVWSPPYFDQDGGNIWMTTYSYPIYEDDDKTRLYGVVTSDVPVPAPK